MNYKKKKEKKTPPESWGAETATCPRALGVEPPTPRLPESAPGPSGQRCKAAPARRKLRSVLPPGRRDPGPLEKRLRRLPHPRPTSGRARPRTHLGGYATGAVPPPSPPRSTVTARRAPALPGSNSECACADRKPGFGPAPAATASEGRCLVTPLSQDPAPRRIALPVATPLPTSSLSW